MVVEHAHVDNSFNCAFFLIVGGVPNTPTESHPGKHNNIYLNICTTNKM